MSFKTSLVVDFEITCVTLNFFPCLYMLLQIFFLNDWLIFVRERSSITSAHRRGVGGLTENADAADASMGGEGGSQVKIDDVILEHICWKIPTNNLIYIQLNSYSDYSSRWLWSPNLEIHWLIGFSEVSFLSLMMIFVPKTIIKSIWNSPTKQYRNPNYVFKYYISEVEGGGGLAPCWFRWCRGGGGFRIL